MSKQELYLKTIFCCMACDGDIANEEIEMLKSLASSSEYFNEINTEECLNAYIANINELGTAFLKQYLSEVASAEMSEKEQLTMIELAFKTIEADKKSNILK